MIVTPDIEMPDPSSFSQLAAAHAATAARLEASAERLRIDNRTRETAARSPGFEVGHLKMRQAEVAAAGGADYYRRLSTAATSAATRTSEVALEHAALVRLAEAELQQPDADRTEIVARYHAAARDSTESGVAAMSTAVRFAVTGLGAPDISALTGMIGVGGAPAAPPRPLDALDNPTTTDPGQRGENAGSASAHDADVDPGTRMRHDGRGTDRRGQ